MRCMFAITGAVSRPRQSDSIVVSAHPVSCQHDGRADDPRVGERFLSRVPIDALACAA